MKKIKNLFRTTVATVVLGSGLIFSSCNDFLTIYPTNSVTHEDYWKTEADVNGMLAAAYHQLVMPDAVSRYIIWGEARSDAMYYRLATASQGEYTYIADQYLTEENSFCNWSIFYKAINYANMVLEFAPEVVSIDPDFTEGDLKIVKGEMYALRAFCHFYLLRTFRDIPMSYKASVTEDALPDYPQIEPMTALASIMEDLDLAQDMVMKSNGFPKSQSRYNYGRFTRNAVFALKADVALWQAAFAEYKAKTGETGGVSDDAQADDNTDAGANDGTATVAATSQSCIYYQQAANYCDSVINAMQQYSKEQYEKMNVEIPTMGENTDNPYYLITNYDPMNKPKNPSLLQSDSYDMIFGFGNSTESIFELQFDGNTIYSSGSYVENKSIIDFYGIGNGKSTYCVPQSYMEGASGVFKDFAEDWRRATFTSAGDNNEGGDIDILKYGIETSGSASAGDNVPARSAQSSSSCEANWIVYRKTDVMLMKAEALAHLGNFNEAFGLIQAVNNRSTRNDNARMKRESYSDDKILDLVLSERGRELAFEGKRWYDLVRKALCDGSTDNIKGMISAKSPEAATLSNRLSNINNLFFPISKNELNVNPLLKQNPAYETSSSIEQN